MSTAARTEGSVALEQLPWERLRSVRLRGGRKAEFVLQAHGGSSVVPLAEAPEGFLERLQSLKGFDNMALVSGLARPRDAEFICWRA